jgi:hypothetical protein
MICFHCEQPARGICRFCGRALCKDHMKQRLPYIVTIYVGEHNVPKAIAVRDVLWCSVCKPEPEPVEMPELY